MGSRYPSVWCLVLVATMVLLATAGRAQVAEPTSSASAAGLGGTEGYRVPDDWRDLLRVDEEMRRYFAGRVPRVSSVAAKVDAIVAAILDKDGLAFTYLAEGNFDAREAFRRRQGNCMAFSLLLMAVARDFRLTAHFNEVRTEPQWSRVGPLVAEIHHLNVVVRTGTGSVVVDLLPLPGPGGAGAAGQPVSDERAFAMFYSNRGVFLLGRGSEGEGLALLERATTIAPGFARCWVNLANAFSFLGDTARAQACFERALRLAPADLGALSGLAQLCRRTGQSERARRLEKRTEHYRERNPYYLAELARRDLAAGDTEVAAKRLRRALAIKDDELEFYELAISAARQLGRAKEADRWERRRATLQAQLRPETGGAPPLVPQ